MKATILIVMMKITKCTQSKSEESVMIKTSYRSILIEWSGMSNCIDRSILITSFTELKDIRVEYWDKPRWNNDRKMKIHWNWTGVTRTLKPTKTGKNIKTNKKYYKKMYVSECNCTTCVVCTLKELSLNINKLYINLNEMRLNWIVEENYLQTQTGEIGIQLQYEIHRFLKSIWNHVAWHAWTNTIHVSWPISQPNAEYSYLFKFGL